MAAIEAGVRDLEPGDNGATVFLTELSDLDALTKTLPAQGFKVLSAELRYRSKNPVTLTDAQRAEVEEFLQAIDDDDDVQNVYPGIAG